MTDYTSVPFVKRHLGIDKCDGETDGLIQGAVSAASREIDKRTGTAFSPTTEERFFYGRPDGSVWVDQFVDTTGLIVETGSPGYWNTAIADTDFTLWPLNAPSKGQAYRRIITAYPYCWGPPHTRGMPNFRITATWGWPTVPADVAEAALLWAAQLFRRKDSPELVVGALDETISGVSRPDPYIARLLAPYGDSKLR